MSQPPRPVWKFEDFLPYIPPRGFIHDYVRYGINCTDAPPMYHILSALAVASAGVAPWLDLEHESVLYPLHLFILLVGESTSRKSSAMRRARRLAAPVFAELSQRGDRIWEMGTSSPEGVLEELAREPNRLILLNEWSALHRTSGKAKYWQHASELWNAAYDADDMQRTLAGGKKFKIERPRITILGASTHGLVLDAVDNTDWLGGKMGRYIIGCSERPQSARMLDPIDLPEEVARLRAILKDIVAPVMRRPAVLSIEARQLIDSWEDDKLWNEAQERATAHLRPSYGRAREHMLRVATIFEASMRMPHEHVVVGPAAMNAAIALVDWCLESAAKTFPLLNSDQASPIVKVLSILKAAADKGLTRSQVLRHSRLSAKQLIEVLVTLQERNELRTVEEKTSGRAVTRYFHVIPDKSDR
jgi:hypothetical protein